MIGKLFSNLIENYLKNLTKGRLTIHYPDGRETYFGSPDSEEWADLIVRNECFFRRTLFGGDIGFGESFMKGEWDSTDLTGLIALFIKNREAMGEYRFPFARILAAANSMRHRRRRNTPRMSRRNTREHYDLSDHLFETFLDPTMTYSCAFFEREEDTLEKAQKAKLQRIIQKSEIQAEDRVLEIGSGWGSFVLAATEARCCHVTAVTLSENQRRYLETRVAENHALEHILVLQSDYRELEGESLYDKIVSIEMLEAVGYEFLGHFFQTCDRLLRTRGRIVLQVITISDKYFDEYKKGCDWIQKHIFPGGFLPSITILEKTIRERSSLLLRDVEDIGIHYVRTLREWRNRFEAHRREVLALGLSEEFYRKFFYYFSYCEAAFATRALGVQQIVLSR